MPAALLQISQVQTEPLAIAVTQHIQRCQHRATVDMHQFQGHRQLVGSQFAMPAIQALAQAFRIQFQQGPGVLMQVTDDQRIAIVRMPGQRQHHRQVVTTGGKASGHMEQRLQQTDLRLHGILATQVVQVLVQARLTLP